MRWVVVVVACAAGTAQADRYPETYVDRPLVMYAGMTSLDISEDVERYSTNGTRYDEQLDLDVAYSFGPVELDGELVGALAKLGATIQAGCHGAVYATLDYFVPQLTDRYQYQQSLGYFYKAPLVPHELAVYASARAFVLEESLTPMMAEASAGTRLRASLAATAAYQLGPRLLLEVGGDVGIPIAKSASLLIDPRAAGDGYVELVQTFHAWDLYVSAGIGDLTETRSLFGAAGFQHRWGG